jgi:hypothetical protein
VAFDRGIITRTERELVDELSDGAAMILDEWNGSG